MASSGVSRITMRTKFGVAVFIWSAACNSPLLAQQKGQYIPGQYGLNAGVQPEAGFSYANMTVNYSADSLKNSSGSSVPVLGTYDIWAVENIFSYVPNNKVLGGKLGFTVIAPTLANGSVTVPQFGVSAGGFGVGDIWVQPVGLGWKLPRADLQAAYSFMAPTGRYSEGANDNIGSGYWGHHLTTGSTLYLTKNKGTSANLFTDWEIHQQKKESNVTPGQTFTMEWGWDRYCL